MRAALTRSTWTDLNSRGSAESNSTLPGGNCLRRYSPTLSPNGRRSLEEGTLVANTVSCPAVLVQHSTLAGISYTSEGSHINEVCKTHTDKKDRRSKASPGSFGNHRAQAGAGALSVSSRDVLAGRPPVRPWPDR